MELGFKQIVNALAQRCIGNQRGVEPSRAEVDLAESHFDVAQQVDEERELASHGLEQLERSGLSEVLLEREADAEPGRNQQTGLRPSEDPRDRAKIGELG